MKRLLPILLMCFLLVGCRDQQVFEPVEDVYAPQQLPDPLQIRVNLPEDAAASAMEAEPEGMLYSCQDATVCVYTVKGGDMDKTVRDATGYPREALQMIQTKDNGMDRYICVWSSAAENSLMVGRACILDDGNYHYVLTVLSEQEKAGVLNTDSWQEVFRSFRALTPEQIVNSGS